MITTYKTIDIYRDLPKHLRDELVERYEPRNNSFFHLEVFDKEDCAFPNDLDEYELKDLEISDYLKSIGCERGETVLALVSW